MQSNLCIVMAQLDFLVGDITHNCQKIVNAVERAVREYRADLVICSELAITGYPPEDLLLRADFHQQVQAALLNLCQTLPPSVHVIVGYPGQESAKIYNMAAVIFEGQIIATYQKQRLPNYGVFDEKRYFTPGHAGCIFEIYGVKIALMICEDLWFPEPMAQAKALGAQLAISINASPYDYQKHETRIQVIAARAKEGAIPIIYVHGVGAQDELLFDGGSMALSSTGECQVQAKFFEEDLVPVLVQSIEGHLRIESQPQPLPMRNTASIYAALVLGTRQYIRKNKFKGALIGLSGGIDSALTLAIAVDAIGKENVRAVMLPSRYTSDLSLQLAREMAKNLEVKWHEISIEPTFSACLQSLAPIFDGLASDMTEENIQARCRAVILMALSNKFQELLLNTGNKSEIAVGYSTLYGDSAGGFAVLKDVSKTWVYSLAHYRNRLSPVIPERIITRAPSAELRPDQKDQDTLPPYADLDRILELYVEQDKSLHEIVACGFEPNVVAKVLKLVDHSEYKRRQGAPGIRITGRAFGRDRRYPITNGFHH